MKMVKPINLIYSLLILLTSKVFDIMERSVSGLNHRELLCSCHYLFCLITKGVVVVIRRQPVLAKEVDPYAGSSIFNILFQGIAFGIDLRGLLSPFRIYTKIETYAYVNYSL